MDDAVDEIIEMVMSKQGQVVFVDNGSLDAHQRIALVLRY
jgi:inosine-uridine nucleoside N-ribohydrolase